MSRHTKERTNSQEWPPEVRAAWLEARQLNAERLGGAAAAATLLDQVSGIVPGTRQSFVKILD